jgi:hypothetical protein
MTHSLTGEYHGCSNVLYIPEALTQHNGDQLPAISGDSRVVTLANLLRPLVMQVSSTLKILFGGGICAFRIQHVNYQNIENCAVLGYYAASSGISLRTFLNNSSVPSSRVKNKKKLEFH